MVFSDIIMMRFVLLLLKLSMLTVLLLVLGGVAAKPPKGSHHQEEEEQRPSRILQAVDDTDPMAVGTTMTTLEQLMTRAYQEKIQDGTWHSIFSDLELISPQPFCSGNTESWPWPKIQIGSETVGRSDLEKVITGRIFNCGYVKNIKFTAAQDMSDGVDGSMSSSSLRDVVLIETNETHAEGLLVDYWNAMIDYINKEAFKDVGEDPILLQWKLYDTPDEALEALLAGEIDAACARWDVEGNFKLSDVLSQEVSRLYVMRAQTCPSYLSQTFSYARKRRGEVPLSEFASAIENGRVRNVCVRSVPSGSLEESCETELNEYSTSQQVTCSGYGPTAIQPYFAGVCQAVWENYSPVSYFRQYDLFMTENQDLPPSRKTPLELAITHVFSSLIYELIWEDYFASISNLEITDFCNSHNNIWPLPQVTSKVTNDLEGVLSRGTFRCGYTKGFLALSPDDNQVLIDTRDAGNVSGAVPAFWERLIAQLGNEYGKKLKLEWKLFSSSDEAFTALHDADVDANCGYWSPKGVYETSTGDRLSRPLAFSMFTCPTFYETSYIYTPIGSGVDNFDALLADIETVSDTGDNEQYSICVADGAAGGIVQTCQLELGRYIQSRRQEQVPSLLCVGAPTGTTNVNEWAFQSMSNGECNAVWGGAPPPGSMSDNTEATEIPATDEYHSFPQPTKFAPTTFFRAFDYIQRTQTSAPTASPPATMNPTTVEQETPTVDDASSNPGSTSGCHTNNRILFASQLFNYFLISCVFLNIAFLLY